MPLADKDSTVARSLEEELLLMLSRQGKRVPIPVFLAAALIAAFASKYVDKSIWIAWIGIVALVLLLRWAVLSKLPELNQWSVISRIRTAILLSATNGVIHGLSLGFFPVLSEFERALQSMLMVGLCAGSVATTAGYMPIFLAYVIPTLLPLSILWLISPGLTNTTWVQSSVGGLVFLFIVVFIALARDSFRLFKESFDIRSQRDAMNNQLQQALDQAEAANSAKTRFLASASHDLRQPIHTLSLFGASLAMRPMDERSKEIVEHMNVALQALASQMDSLLDISKLDAGIVSANISPIHLRALLIRLREEFSPTATEKGIQLSIECAPNLFIESDELLFERVLRNLLANAIKYTDRGKVEIDVTDQSSLLILTVSDTGRGIPEHDRKRIFEEFYQIENPERDRTKGLGLGLAIVQRLVSLLEIKLELESQPGIGSKFHLLLPKGQAVVTNIEGNHLKPADWASLHVLVVDDESMVRVGMKTLLEGLGCRVSTADGSDQAISLSNTDRPDIVLADFRLRGKDNGIHTIHAIRNLYPQTPAILISGDTAPDRLHEAKKAGIELLPKPVPVDTLKQAILDACGIRGATSNG